MSQIIVAQNVNGIVLAADNQSIQLDEKTPEETDQDGVAPSDPAEKSADEEGTIDEGVTEKGGFKVDERVVVVEDPGDETSVWIGTIVGFKGDMAWVTTGEVEAPYSLDDLRHRDELPSADFIPNVGNGPVFASGLQRSPTEIRAAIEAGQPVGIAVFNVVDGKVQTLSNTVKQLLIDYANAGGKVFIDSGAFNAFRAEVDIDWNRVKADYGAIIAAVEYDKRKNIYVVAPDVVGQQEKTLNLQWDNLYFMQEWVAQGANLIVPVQTGEDTIATSWANATNSFSEEVTEDLVVGIPFNAKAFAQEQVVAFVKGQVKWMSEGKKVKIHLLGGGESKTISMLSELEKAGVGLDRVEVSGDALYKGASERKSKGKSAVEPKESSIPFEAAPKYDNSRIYRVKVKDVSIHPDMQFRKNADKKTGVGKRTRSRTPAGNRSWPARSRSGSTRAESCTWWTVIIVLLTPRSTALKRSMGLCFPKPTAGP